MSLKASKQIKIDVFYSPVKLSEKKGKIDKMKIENCKSKFTVVFVGL